MKVDYANLIQEFPWIAERGLNCVISPDSDGFLCGLLMTHALGWCVKGFYDGKVLVLTDGTAKEDCVFLDMDINRDTIKSVGHHMVVYNNNCMDSLVSQGYLAYSNCIQPNIMRSFDGAHDFQRKYPFATIHLLAGIVQNALGDKLAIGKEGVWPLLFTDGVWNNLFGYTENCLDWISWLRIDHPSHSLYPFFCASQHTFYEIMEGMNRFLRLRDSYNASGIFQNGSFSRGGRSKRTGDKLRISDAKGRPVNLVPGGHSTYSIHENERNRIVSFIKEMSQATGWLYHEDKWCWRDLSLMVFTKQDFSATRLNNTTYAEMLSRYPFSMAMTCGTNVEYTLPS